MLMIRLQRVGRKGVPTFRVVLTDRRNSTKSGRFLEVLGAYDPRHNGIKTFNIERISHWLKEGAKPSSTLHNLFIDEKIISGKKLNVLPRKSPPKKEAPKGEAPTTATESSSPVTPEEATVPQGEMALSGEQKS